MNNNHRARTNEYFVPRDGIDREVITADICRYLGNDALVRPGTRVGDNGQPEQGYFITAYRNLTSAMIDDLKMDSARWSQERRRALGTARYLDSQVNMERRMGGNYGNPTYGGPYRDKDYPRQPSSGASGPSTIPPYNGSYAPNDQYGQPPRTQPPPNYGGGNQQLSPQDTGYGGGPGSIPSQGVPVTGYPTGNVSGLSTSLAPDGYMDGMSYTVTSSSRDPYPVDMAMGDAPMTNPPPRRTSPPSGVNTYGNPAANPRGTYPVTANTGYGGSYTQPLHPGAAYSQPIDVGYGRAAAPTSGYTPRDAVPQYDDPAFPPSPNRTGSAPGNTQTQLSSASGPTGPPRRNDRDRMMVDRPDNRDRERERERERDHERKRERERGSTPPNRTGSATKVHHYPRH